MRTWAITMLGLALYGCAAEGPPAGAGAAAKDDAARPAGATAESNWPRTYEEAVARLAAGLRDEDKALLRATRREDLIQFHMGWGTEIRNSFGLWQGNEELMRSCVAHGRPELAPLARDPNYQVGHPDDVSMMLIEGVWESRQDADPSPGPAR